MLAQLRDVVIASVRRRIEQGDCPTERAHSTETLENVIIDLTTPSQGLNAATVERCEALRQAVANVLPIGNDRLPGDKVIPFYIRMDELRALRALATEPHQHGGKGA